MQTFLPYPDFTETAKVLDMKRLGKQRVEAMQIANCIANGRVGGWSNHPAVRMWDGHLEWLIDYSVAICTEWKGRGYRDTCQERIEALRGLQSPTEGPEWLGDNRLHASHRSKLLMKKPDYYNQFGWTEPDDMDYWWPV